MNRPTETQSQPGSASGGSASGFKLRVLAYCLDHGIEMTSSKAQRLGVRLARRMDRMCSQAEFEQGLRILGIYADPTARDAIRRMEVA